MGTSKVGTLSSSQTAEILQSRTVMINLGEGGSGKFVFFAAFDGTNNDRNNLSLSGSGYQTNVANLFDQADAASKSNPNLQARYYPGVGTGGENGNLINAAFLPTAAIHYAAEQALADFARQAQEYLQANPDATFADITAAAVGFSRGSATAVVFAQLLEERGLVTADGTVIAPPGAIKVNGLALIDPVYTFIDGDMTIPANVTGPVLNVRALNEDRKDFAAASYRNDMRVITVEVYGNHCGVGGGYDQAGTAAAVLEGVTGFLQGSGVALADVPAQLRFDPETPASLYSELYQTARNGDLLVDAEGKPQLAWRPTDGGGRAIRVVPSPADSHDPTDPYSADAVNGQDLESDQHQQPPLSKQGGADVPVGYRYVDTRGSIYEYTAEGTLDRTLAGGWKERWSEDGTGSIVDSQGRIAAALEPGDVVSFMDDGRITINDASGQLVSRVASPEVAGSDFYVPATPSVAAPTPVAGTHDFSTYLSGAGAKLSDQQQDGIAALLDSLNFGDTRNLTFTTVGASTLIANSDGDIVGEIYKDEQGPARLTAHRLNSSGGVESVDNYILPSGQILTSQQYEEMRSAQQADQAANALGLMNSIIGLQHWDQMNDLQRTAALIGIYNAVDKIGGGRLPGDLGAAAGVIGVLNALDTGNVGSALYSGLYLAESLTATAATATTAVVPGVVSTTLGKDFLPALGLVLAIESGDPASIVASGLNLAASLGWIGGWGYVAGAVITVLGAIFADTDLPTSEGAAHAQWNAQGELEIVTDRNEHDGGPTAEGWMRALATGLQTELAKYTDADDRPLYALVPNLLPRVGFTYDPDGFNYYGSQGHLYLSWVDENGVTQTRYYDGHGERSDGSGETLAGDFMQHALDAIAPAWAVQTTLRHWQAGEGLHLPTQKAGLPQTTQDGLHQYLQVLTLALPGSLPQAMRQSLVDIDADGYLEATAWVAGNQAMLAIDADGNGLIGAGELLNLDDDPALNSLRWLDADGDGRVDARDPAFAALRLWLDVNGDGISLGETQNMAQAGILAIDFSANPPRVEYADGHTRALTAQMLSGDTLGAQWHVTAGGLLELSEQLDGDASAVLAAVNTRAFDGQAEHMHGGERTVVDAGDARLRSVASPAEIDVTHIDLLIDEAGAVWVSDGAGGRVLAGQGPSSIAVTAVLPAQVRSRGELAFVPVDTPARTIADVLAGQVRSAAAGEALLALAAGATAAADATAFALAADGWPEGMNELSSSAGAGAITDAPLRVHDDGVAAAPKAFTPGIALDAGRLAELTAEYADSPSTAVLAWVPDDDRPVPHSMVGSAGASSGSVLGMALPLPATNADARESAATAIAPATNPDGAPAVAGAGAMLVPPTAVDDALDAREDERLLIEPAVLLRNDIDGNGGASLRVAAVDRPVHGEVRLLTDGRIDFVPEPGFHGTAGFRYTADDGLGTTRTAWVSVELQSVNDAPHAKGEHLTADEDEPLEFRPQDLLANDRDPDASTDGDALRITRVGEAEHGRVMLLPDGRIRFQPEADFHGLARFTYWVADEAGAESPAQVQIDVRAVNDLPIVTGEVIAGEEDVALRIAAALLLANDADPDARTDGQMLTIGAVGDALHGRVSLQNGHILFTPERDYAGAAGFSYRVDDGAGGEVWAYVRVDLAAMNDIPSVVGEQIDMAEDQAVVIDPALLLANDSDIDNTHDDLRIVSVGNATHGEVVLVPGGAIRFTPAADYVGNAYFTYTLSDGSGGFAIGTTELRIAPVNDAPQLTGERLMLDQDAVARFTPASLLANDCDVDNVAADLRVVEVGHAVHGTVALVDGHIVFTPERYYVGAASFTYTVSDGAGGLSQAQVDLTFLPVNHPAQLQGELFLGRSDTAYTFTAAALLANDTDAETPEALHIVGVSAAKHGSATLLADGSVRFTPEVGYTGIASFDYTVEDGDGALATATAQIDFSGVNTAPLLTDDSFLGFEDVPFMISATQLLLNDRDPDGDPTQPHAGMRIDAVSAATHGAVMLDAQGNVQFVPEADYFGAASFRYRVTDADGASTWATAYLTVQAQNDAPIIEDVIVGTPIYGYEFLDNGMLAPVFSEAHARDLLLAHPEGAPQPYFMGYLLDADGSAITASMVSFYRNGQLKPWAVDTRDVAYDDWDFDPRYIDGEWYDDPYRQRGIVIAYDPDGDSSQISLRIAEGPVHGHLWVNSTVRLVVEGADVTQTNIQDFLQPTPGGWQYVSHWGDPYQGPDPFVIQVVDASGAATDLTISPQQFHTGTISVGIGRSDRATGDVSGAEVALAQALQPQALLAAESSASLAVAGTAPAACEATAVASDGPPMLPDQVAMLFTQCLAACSATNTEADLAFIPSAAEEEVMPWPITASDDKLGMVAAVA